MTETRLSSYGNRARFGPFYKQAVRWIGRSLVMLGERLNTWSWR